MYSCVIRRVAREIHRIWQDDARDEKSRKPSITWLSGFIQMHLDNLMVEAGGIEPPSENIPLEASTGLVQE